MEKDDANVDRKSLWLGHMPLFYAVRNGYETIVDTLIEQNANLNVKDSNGSFAIHLAAKEGLNQYFSSDIFV